MDGAENGASATLLADAITRRRRRRSSGEGDDALLDAMLQELGIPTSDSKKKQKKHMEDEIIELITPPRPLCRVPSASDTETKSEETHCGCLADDSILDLTTPTPPSSGKWRRMRSPLNTRHSIVDLLSTDGSEVGDCDSVQQQGDDDVSRSPLQATETQRRRRHLLMTLSDDDDTVHGDEDSDDERLLRAVTETQTQIQLSPSRSKPSTSRVEASQRTEASIPLRRPTNDDEPSLPAPKKRGRQQKNNPPKQVVLAAITIEKRLSDSPVGAAIKTALEGNVYNNKPVPFVLETPFESDWNVIQWERRGETSQVEPDASRHVIAMHYPAAALLELLADHGYDALVSAVKRLEDETLQMGHKKKKTVAWGSVVLIVEGMDRALIARSKKSKEKAKVNAKTNAKRKASESAPFTVMFSDLHELAFRLFMDTSVHTKFTSDTDATAAYVALLTREIIVAAVKQTNQEEFLESVPRGHSFRVLPSSGSTLNPFANTWLRMLQMIPSVSEDRAQSVLDHFPTVQSLLHVYNDPSRSVNDKEELLADKLNGTRMESALSRRIFRVFSGWNESGAL